MVFFNYKWNGFGMKFLKFNRVWYIKYLEAFKFGKALLIHTKPIANPIFSGVASTKKFFLQISIHYSHHTKRNLCGTLQRLLWVCIEVEGSKVWVELELQTNVVTGKSILSSEN